MTTHHFVRLWPVMLLGTISACAHVENSAAGETAPRKPAMTEHESVADAGASKPMQAGKSDSLTNAIAADLSKRLGVPLVQIQVVAVDAMTWNDGSLGCGQSGQSYTQALVPGFRVILQHAGKAHEYHASDKGAYVYCPNATRTSDGLDKE